MESVIAEISIANNNEVLYTHNHTYSLLNVGKKFGDCIFGDCIFGDCPWVHQNFPSKIINVVKYKIFLFYSVSMHL